VLGSVTGDGGLCPIPAISQGCPGGWRADRRSGRRSVESAAKARKQPFDEIDSNWRSERSRVNPRDAKKQRLVLQICLIVCKPIKEADDLRIISETDARRRCGRTDRKAGRLIVWDNIYHMLTLE
jgi:hypothetical protein